MTAAGCGCARCTEPVRQDITCAGCAGVIVPYLRGVPSVDWWPRNACVLPTPGTT